jgi:hypothetical protein
MGWIWGWEGTPSLPSVHPDRSMHHPQPPNPNPQTNNLTNAHTPPPNPRMDGRAYLLTDVQSRQAELMGSGATAVTCLIKKRRRRRPREGEGEGEEVEVRDIYAANVGDSRAVLCHQGKGVRLTYDHKADDGA